MKTKLEARRIRRMRTALATMLVTVGVIVAIRAVSMPKRETGCTWRMIDPASRKPLSRAREAITMITGRSYTVEATCPGMGMPYWYSINP